MPTQTLRRRVSAGRWSQSSPSLRLTANRSLSVPGSDCTKRANDTLETQFAPPAKRGKRAIDGQLAPTIQVDSGIVDLDAPPVVQPSILDHVLDLSTEEVPDGLFYHLPAGSTPFVPKAKVIDGLVNQPEPFFPPHNTGDLTSTTVQWEEMDEEFCGWQDGLLRTNITPEWPIWIPTDRFARDSREYLDLVKCLYSPYAHRVSLAFRFPDWNEAEIYEIRDRHLRDKCPFLGQLDSRSEDGPEPCENPINPLWEKWKACW